MLSAVPAAAAACFSRCRILPPQPQGEPQGYPRGKKGVKIWGAGCLNYQVLVWTAYAQHFRNRGGICKTHGWLQSRPSALSKPRYSEGDHLWVVAASRCRSEGSASSLLPRRDLQTLLGQLATDRAWPYIHQSLGSSDAAYPCLCLIRICILGHQIQCLMLVRALF